MLRTRIATGLIALAAVLAMVTLAPAGLFTAFIAVVTAWGLYEVASMYASGQPLLMLPLALVGGVPAAWILLGHVPDWPSPAVLILAMAGLMVLVGVRGAGDRAHLLSTALLGSLYVGVLFPYFALLRNQPQGIRLVIVMLLLVVASDTGAYLAGNRWGHTKLAPRVSPGKTVEGAIASVASSLVAVVLLRRMLPGVETVSRALVFALIINLLAQIGDLAESALKRIAGVKDSGWLFPGHGGLLDRTDSLVFAAVFTYYYTK